MNEIKTFKKPFESQDKNIVFMENEYLILDKDMIMQKLSNQTKPYKKYFFHSRKIQTGSVWIYGIIYSGKSVLSQQIIQTLGNKKYTNIYYITNLENTEQDEFLQNYEKVQKLDDEDFISQLSELVEEIKENKKETQEIKKGLKYNFLSSIIIIDDLCSTKQMFLNKKFLYLMKTIRHHDCLLVLLTQDSQQIDLKNRLLFTNIVLFKGLSNLRLKQVYEYFSTQLTVEEFQKLYYETTQEQFQYILFDKFYRFFIFKNNNTLIYYE